MDAPQVIALMMNGGLLLMLLVPGIAALLAKLRRGRGSEQRRAGERAAEIDDVFSPGRRRQVEEQEAVDMLRVDADNGDDDPLGDFPDPDGLRDQLDPDHVHEARRARSSRHQ